MTTSQQNSTTHPETGPGNSEVSNTPIGRSGEIIFKRVPSASLVEDPLVHPRTVVQQEAARTSPDALKTVVSQAIGENFQQK